MHEKVVHSHGVSHPRSWCFATKRSLEARGSCVVFLVPSGPWQFRRVGLRLIFSVADVVTLTCFVQLVANHLAME